MNLRIGSSGERRPDARVRQRAGDLAEVARRRRRDEQDGRRELAGSSAAMPSNTMRSQRDPSRRMALAGYSAGLTVNRFDARQERAGRSRGTDRRRRRCSTFGAAGRAGRSPRPGRRASRWSSLAAARRRPSAAPRSTVAPCGHVVDDDLGPRLRLELGEVLGLDEDAVGPDLELPPGRLDVEVRDAHEHRARHARRSRAARRGRRSPGCSARARPGGR